MNVSAKPLVMKLYRAYLRSRLERYTRDLQAIAEQRENDFQAERILHQAVVSVRSKLHSLEPWCRQRCRPATAQRSTSSNKPCVKRASTAAGMAPASSMSLSFNASPMVMRSP